MTGYEMWQYQQQQNQGPQVVPMGYQGIPSNSNYGPITTVRPSSIPGRTIFSPEQISPQEIPTTGEMAYFPASDGTYVIARCQLPNGQFGERRYVLEQPQQKQNSEFEQVMAQLNTIQISLNKIASDLYGNEPSEAPAKVKEVKK